MFQFSYYSLLLPWPHFSSDIYTNFSLLLDDFNFWNLLAFRLPLLSWSDFTATITNKYCCPKSLFNSLTFHPYIYRILVEKMRELSLLIFTKLLSVVHSPAKALSASQQGQQACQPLPQALSCPCRNPQVPTYPPPPPQPGWYLPHPVLQTSWTWKQLEQGESSSRHWCQCAWRGLYSTSQGKRRQPPHLCLPPCWLAPAWRGHSSAWSHSIPRGHETFWKGPPGVQFSSGHELWGPTDQSSSDPTTQPPP